MADERASKAEVDYSRGHKNSRCGICRYFRKPKSCALVMGKISPEMWCKLFKKKGTQ